MQINSSEFVSSLYDRLELKPAHNKSSYRPAPRQSDAVRAQLSAASMVKYEESRNIGVSIETQDGDMVRLLINSEFGFQSGTVAVQGEDDEAFASQTSVHQQTRMDFTVEGELDRDELKAIRKTLKKVEKITDKLFDGKVEKATSKLEKLGRHFNTDELSGIDVHLSSHRSLELAAAYFIEPVQTAPTDSIPDGEPSEIPSPVAATETDIGTEDMGEVEIEEQASADPSGVALLDFDSLMQKFNEFFDDLIKDALFPRPGQLIADMIEAVVDMKFTLGQVDQTQVEEVQDQLEEPLEALRARDDA